MKILDLAREDALDSLYNLEIGSQLWVYSAKGDLIMSLLRSGPDEEYDVVGFSNPPGPEVDGEHVDMDEAGKVVAYVDKLAGPLKYSIGK